MPAASLVSVSFTAQAGVPERNAVVGKTGTEMVPNDLEGGPRPRITPRIRYGSA